MSRILRAALVVATVGMAASASQAQTVAMYGEYHESNGIIVNIPQNPPIVPCVPPPLLVAPPSHQTVGGLMTFQHLDLRPTGVNDARCHDREQHVNFTTMQPGVFNQPQVGNRGARTAMAGLNVGDPFTIPPFAFEQNLGLQVGIVLQNVTRQLDTAFIAAMPGIDRIGPNPGPLPAGSYTVKTAMQPHPGSGADPHVLRRQLERRGQRPQQRQAGRRLPRRARRPTRPTSTPPTAATSRSRFATARVRTTSVARWRCSSTAPLASTSAARRSRACSRRPSSRRPARSRSATATRASASATRVAGT
jgi:hypothetical protein